MAEHEHNDMVFYIIAGLVALVLINLVWRWLVGGYYNAAIDATPLR